MFKFILNNGIEFINHHTNFKNTIKSKLKEFYFKENLKFVKPWYKKIFNTEISK